MTSNTLKQRFSNHLSNNINNWGNTSMARHFMNDHNIFSDLKLALLDQTHDTLSLRIREGFWIRQLQTVSTGMNEKEEANLMIDYQVLNFVKHFRHCNTCTRHLRQHQAQVLKPCTAAFGRSKLGQTL
jgi:hypothetical protein